jgi:RNase P/RNase MRP subunit p29
MWWKLAVGSCMSLAMLMGSVPLAIAQNDDAKEWRISGVVQKKQPNQLTIRTEDNRTVVVDTSQARRQTADRINVGERVSVAGTFTGPQRMEARAIRDLGSGSKQTQGDWERIHGRIEAVDGSNLRFRADDGRTLNVDMSNVGTEIRRALTQGERATVIGYQWLGPNRLRAEYIQQDSSRGAGSPAASAKAAGSGTPRISGRVGVIGGSTMDMRTNDGRTIVVDLSEVSPDLVKSLNPGDPITVNGKLSGSNLKAQSLQKASR